MVPAGYRSPQGCTEVNLIERLAPQTKRPGETGALDFVTR
jgi:hypothetical protein